MPGTFEFPASFLHKKRLSLLTEQAFPEPGKTDNPARQGAALFSGQTGKRRCAH